MIGHRKLRVLLGSSLALQMRQQLCGINAVFYYSASFFEGVIDNPLVGTTIVGAVNVLATYMALLLIPQPTGVRPQAERLREALLREILKPAGITGSLR
jgi:hypothetical protein